jgi:hypothetical protein
MSSSERTCERCVYARSARRLDWRGAGATARASRDERFFTSLTGNWWSANPPSHARLCCRCVQALCAALASGASIAGGPGQRISTACRCLLLAAALARFALHVRLLPLGLFNKRPLKHVEALPSSTSCGAQRLRSRLLDVLLGLHGREHDHLLHTTPRRGTNGSVRWGRMQAMKQSRGHAPGCGACPRAA